MKTRHADGTVHYSLLKELGQLSPLHYVTKCEEDDEDPTSSQRVGTGTHFLLLGAREGQRVIRFDGADRRAKGWKEFAAENDGADILTMPEWDQCEAIADAVRRDPVLADKLGGPDWLKLARKEVPLKWTASGLPCSTSGVDLVGDGWIADLKTTGCAEPNRFVRHCINMAYHGQLAFYGDGALENKIDVSKGFYIIGVETKKPYAVTLLELTENAILQGRKLVTKWLERLRGCEADQLFPGYSQTAVPFDIPEWKIEIESEDGEVAA